MAQCQCCFTTLSDDEYWYCESCADRISVEGEAGENLVYDDDD